MALAMSDSAQSGHRDDVLEEPIMTQLAVASRGAERASALRKTSSPQRLLWDGGKVAPTWEVGARHIGEMDVALQLSPVCMLED